MAMPSIERLSDPRALLPTWTPGASAVAFAAGLALTAGLLTAAASWRRAARLTLHVRGTYAQYDRSRQAGRSMLLAVQVAMCTTLVGVTVLLGRGLVLATSLDPGFALDDVSALDLQVPRDAGIERAAVTARVIETLAQHGFPRAGLVDLLPMDRSNLAMGVRHPGQALADQRTVSLFPMSPGAFDVLGIPLIAGRHARADTMPREMVVNQMFARQVFNGDALDRIVLDRQREYRIVGIVADAQLTELADVRPTVHPMPLLGLPRLVMHSTSGPAVVERLIREVDPRLRISVVSMRDITYASLARARQGAVVAAGTALLGLVLACMGLYAVFGAVVEERRREIGIRMALGARPREVVRHIVSSATIAAVCGLLIGGGLATASGFALRGFLYGLSPLDPLAGIAVMGVLGAAAALSAYLPARRGTRIDPAVALRAE
jgi:putative ABC transport system permease protein